MSSSDTSSTSWVSWSSASIPTSSGQRPSLSPSTAAKNWAVAAPVTPEPARRCGRPRTAGRRRCPAPSRCTRPRRPRTSTTAPSSSAAARSGCSGSRRGRNASSTGGGPATRSATGRGARLLARRLVSSGAYVPRPTTPDVRGRRRHRRDPRAGPAGAARPPARCPLRPGLRRRGRRVGRRRRHQGDRRAPRRALRRAGGQLRSGAAPATPAWPRCTRRWSRSSTPTAYPLPDGSTRCWATSTTPSWAPWRRGWSRAERIGHPRRGADATRRSVPRSTGARPRARCAGAPPSPTSRAPRLLVRAAVASGPELFDADAARRRGRGPRLAPGRRRLGRALRHRRAPSSTTGRRPLGEFLARRAFYGTSAAPLARRHPGAPRARSTSRRWSLAVWLLAVDAPPRARRWRRWPRPSASWRTACAA